MRNFPNYTEIKHVSHFASLSEFESYHINPHQSRSINPEVTGPSYPDVLPEVRFTAGINMTCVEPDGQVKPAWGVLGAGAGGL